MKRKAVSLRWLFQPLKILPTEQAEVKEGLDVDEKKEHAASFDALVLARNARRIYFKANSGIR